MRALDLLLPLLCLFSGLWRRWCQPTPISGDHSAGTASNSCCLRVFLDCPPTMPHGSFRRPFGAMTVWWLRLPAGWFTLRTMPSTALATVTTSLRRCTHCFSRNLILGILGGTYEVMSKIGSFTNPNFRHTRPGQPPNCPVLQRPSGIDRWQAPYGHGVMFVMRVFRAWIRVPDAPDEQSQTFRACAHRLPS